MLDFDRDGRFRLGALQSISGRELLTLCGRRADDISSIVLVEFSPPEVAGPSGRGLGGEAGRAGGAGAGGGGGQGYIKSTAVLKIGSQLDSLPFMPPLANLGLLFPLAFRDTVYDLVADNRYSLMGRREVCRLSDDRFESRFLQ